jgi:membrane-bound metal-dependent hydrolase YbcI (DUF457 family)
MNGKEHAIGGAIGGPLIGITLAAAARRQPSLAEVCGWFAGGVLGAKVPDILEPAFCPNHRRFCHSGCAFVLNVAAVQSHSLQQAVKRMVAVADHYHALAISDSANAASHKFSAYLLEFTSGVLPGLVGGYASHLILDSTTASGLPLI